MGFGCHNKHDKADKSVNLHHLCVRKSHKSINYFQVFVYRVEIVSIYMNLYGSFVKGFVDTFFKIYLSLGI